MSKTKEKYTTMTRMWSNMLIPLYKEGYLNKNAPNYVRGIH